MKLRMLKLICSGILIAATISLAGCVHSASKDTSRRASAERLSAQKQNNAKVFTLTTFYRNMDHTIVPVKHTRGGTISLNLDKNTVSIGSHELILLSVNNEEAHFYNPAGIGSLVHINRLTPGVNASIEIVVTYLSEPGHPSLWDVMYTDKGTFDAFYDYLDQMQFPTKYTGLMASAKCIDGTTIPTESTYIGSLQVTDQGCVLNTKAANLQHTTLADGSGALIISNETGKVVIMPDGKWLFGKGNSLEQFTGADSSLRPIYLELWQGTTVSQLRGKLPQ